MSVLTKSEISELITNHQPPLVEGFVNLAEQLQPNGIDLTLQDVARITSLGQIGASNSNRILSGTAMLPFDSAGFINLTPGCYMITYNEVVNIPPDIMALGRPRSSLLRCGVTIGTAVWDAGYCGRSQSLLTVHNPAGFRIQKNARITQLIFFRLSGMTAGYSGKFQNENVAPR